MCVLYFQLGNNLGCSEQLIKKFPWMSYCLRSKTRVHLLKASIEGNKKPSTDNNSRSRNLSNRDTSPKPCHTHNTRTTEITRVPHNIETHWLPSKSWWGQPHPIYRIYLYQMTMTSYIYIDIIYPESHANKIFSKITKLIKYIESGSLASEQPLFRFC